MQVLPERRFQHFASGNKNGGVCDHTGMWGSEGLPRKRGSDTVLAFKRSSMGGIEFYMEWRAE